MGLSLVLGVLLLCFVFTLYWLTNQENRKYVLPPGPKGLPILGYLPYLGKEPYRVFHELSKKYGNVISLYLGQTFVVVICDFEALKEAYSQPASLYRSKELLDFLPDGAGLVSLNGEDWVEHRKFVMKAMRDLGLGRSKWDSIVQDEVDDLINYLHKFNGAPINISQPLTASVSNNISSFLFGKRLINTEQEGTFFYTVYDIIFQYISMTGWKNYLPRVYRFLVKLGVYDNKEAERKMLMKEFHNFIRKEIEFEKQRYVPGSTENFVHGYMTEMLNNKEQNKKTSLSDVQLRANSQALFLAGADTTRVTLTWVLLCMVKFPEVQKRVNEELDMILGKDKKIQWAERSIIPYTFATIMEAQRWRTTAPLNVARVAADDFKVGGYDIPKRTFLICNSWGLHHDTKFWKEPENFMPERFLSKDGKMENFKPDSYISFSYGKRNCLGEKVAMIEILCYFVAIMQNFHIRCARNNKPNMTGILGINYDPPTQELCFVPRSS